jgi:hypothetical protein
MSDTFEQYDDDEEQQQKMATLPRKEVRRLEKAAKEGREASERLAVLEREREFVKAGVPMDDPRTSYFVAGYSGELNPEAIKAEWSSAFGGGSADAGGPDLSNELDQMHQGQQLVAGSGQPTDNQLAERNAKLSALSMTDPQYTQKFDAICAEYGTRMGSMVG